MVKFDADEQPRNPQRMLVERRRSGIPGPCLGQMIGYSSLSRFVKLMAMLPLTPPAVTLQRPQP